MREHLDKHVASPQQCPHCDKISPNPEALKGHIKRVHLMKKIFKCDLCNKSFKLALALKVRLVEGWRGGILMGSSRFWTESSRFWTESWVFLRKLQF